MRSAYQRTAEDARPQVEHSEPRSRPISWRLLSGAIVLILSGVLALFSTSNAFYVRSIAVGGLQYLTKEEVFAYAGIANMHIFWVDPDVVRQNLLRSSSIADARVTLSWPPNMVNIIIEEREPALVWEQSGTAVWVDVQGRVMAQRENRPDLIRVSADQDVAEGPLGESGRVSEEVVYGALQLQELLPETDLLRYSAVHGLGYKDENGWDVWFGTGTGMPEKLQIYRAMVELIRSRGMQPREINVVNPDAPYIDGVDNVRQ